VSPWDEKKEPWRTYIEHYQPPILKVFQGFKEKRKRKKNKNNKKGNWVKEYDQIREKKEGMEKKPKLKKNQ
jgi:hypothetical protein